MPDFHPTALLFAGNTDIEWPMEQSCRPLAALMRQPWRKTCARLEKESNKIKNSTMNLMFYPFKLLPLTGNE
jgi:hypothetical protein